MHGSFGEAEIPWQPAGPRCSTCMGSLSPGAKICLSCQSYQDWRRFFGMSQIVLTLLVALVSVVSTGTPGFIRAFSRDRSDVRAAYLECKAHEVQVLLTNVGSRVATFRKAKVSTDGRKTWDKEKLWKELHISPEPPPAGRLVEAGKTRILLLTGMGGNFSGNENDSTYDYDVSVEVLGFDHSVLLLDFKCSGKVQADVGARA